MVSYMYVTMVTAEFRYSSFALSTLFTIMIMTSSVSIVISDYIIPYVIVHCSSVIVTVIVHYIKMTSHVKKQNNRGGEGRGTSSGSSVSRISGPPEG